MPKRADSASATWPAGTIGIASAVGADGDGGASTLPGPKPSPRGARSGAINPVEGDAENSELCAEAMVGSANVAISATKNATPSVTAGQSRPRVAAFAGGILMTWAFSAQIAAISSQWAEVCQPNDATRNLTLEEPGTDFNVG